MQPRRKISFFKNHSKLNFLSLKLIFFFCLYGSTFVNIFIFAIFNIFLYLIFPLFKGTKKRKFLFLKATNEKARLWSKHREEQLQTEYALIIFKITVKKKKIKKKFIQALFLLHQNECCLHAKGNQHNLFHIEFLSKKEKKILRIWSFVMFNVSIYRLALLIRNSHLSLSALVYIRKEKSKIILVSINIFTQCRQTGERASHRGEISEILLSSSI